MTLAEFARKKLVNLAFINGARLIKIVRTNKDGTFTCRVYDGNGVTDWTLPGTQDVEVR